MFYLAKLRKGHSQIKYSLVDQKETKGNNSQYSQKDLTPTRNSKAKLTFKFYLSILNSI